MKIIWTLLLILFIPSVYAEAIQCDGAVYDVEVKGFISPYQYELTTLTITNGNEKISKQFESVFFLIACKKNPANKSYVVYQAYCGGSACKDFDNWGIIEPSPLRVLLDPSDDNHEKAEQIFGGELKPFITKKRHKQ